MEEGAESENNSPLPPPNSPARSSPNLQVWITDDYPSGRDAKGTTTVVREWAMRSMHLRHWHWYIYTPHGKRHMYRPDPSLLGDCNCHNCRG